MFPKVLKSCHVLTRGLPALELTNKCPPRWVFSPLEGVRRLKKEQDSSGSTR